MIYLIHLSSETGSWLAQEIKIGVTVPQGKSKDVLLQYIDKQENNLTTSQLIKSDIHSGFRDTEPSTVIEAGLKSPCMVACT